MNLRTYRERQRWTRREMAAHLGVTAMAVYRYENGRKPAPVVLEKILAATAGAVTPNDFYANGELAGQAAEAGATRVSAGATRPAVGAHGPAAGRQRGPKRTATHPSTRGRDAAATQDEDQEWIARNQRRRAAARKAARSRKRKTS